MYSCFDECLHAIIFGVDELESERVVPDDDERECLRVVLGQLNWVLHRLLRIIKLMDDLHILYNQILDQILALAKFKYVWVVDELE